MAHPDLNTVCTLLRDCARREILPRFTRSTTEYKSDGSIVTEADLAMQQATQSALANAWPDIPLIGEETPETERDALLERAGQAIWCLDPLDGTSNFAAGLPFFAASLALLVDRKPVLAAVYDPVRDEMFSAAAGGGAFLNAAPLKLTPRGIKLEKSIAIVDFKRLQAPLATRLAATPPYSSQRSFGSVALDWAWLAAGRYHVYLHGKQKVWDYAAGVLILAEAGGTSSTLDRDPVFTAALTPRSAVAACDSPLYEEWITWLSTSRSA